MLYGISLAVGIVLLTLGGEALIRGAVAGAKRMGVSPLLTGLVVVGFGTSSPELVVSIDAAIRQQPDIAVGNIVGSNIGNILLILGLCAVICPMSVQPLALRRDGVVVVGASLLFVALAWSGALGRWDAVILLAALTAYLIWAYRTERAQPLPAAEMHSAEADELTAIPSSTTMIVMALIVGLAMLIGGSQLLLYGAIGLAQAMGISEAVIGLTIVAVGTSLPEMAVSVIAALRRHADVAVGNILGSNIFNLLGILGISAFLQPLPIAERVSQFDQWVMLGAAGVLLLFLYTGMRLSRWEGAALLGGYVAYLTLSFTIV
ncbi:MAG: calcium/sodium antiporter [Vreelandella alkaliphila]|uniref:Sodium:calcium antiporter n=1 Tax=Halomonas campaniensis TaxID=213554 RepID=A0A3D0KDC6_9GAMM|nr:MULTISPECIES: calcium/sodium antiporter [unclassified Halomonas]HBP41924.1 sodium:calcium antiporter [Halomonas sp.]HBS84331.1 sodium:calcium antiporter [Halomonas campaniensis]HCA01523.1 sodium:calcium antiporter [Halomonas campaniensis]